MDPGTYRIAATAGGKRFEKVVEVAGEGTVVTVDVVFEDATPAPDADGDPGAGAVPDPGAGAGAVPDADPDAEAVADTGGGGGGGRTILGLSTAAVGGVAIGVGLYFGSQASAAFGDAKDVCGGDLVCDTEADRIRSQELVDDARGKGNLSTILVGAGVVAATAGVILWLTAPDGAEREEAALRLAPQVGPDGIGLAAAGVF